MRKLLPVIVLLFLFGCTTNINKEIIGSWEITKDTITNIKQYLVRYKQRYNASDSDIAAERSRVMSMTRYYPVGITFVFKDSNKFYLGGIQGKWKLNKNKLTIKFSRIDSASLNIRKLNKKIMVLSYTMKVDSFPLQCQIQLERTK